MSSGPGDGESPDVGENPESGGSELDDVVLDEEFIRGGVREEAAEVRLERISRISRENNRLQAAGEIADGTGRPSARRMRKAVPWIAFGAVAAVVIIVMALVAR